jgi:hypothetical protein
MRAILTLLAALFMVGASSYITRYGNDRFSVPKAGGDPPLIPAGYAFSIWGLIFLGVIVFAIYQLRSSQAGRDLFRKIGWWTIAAFLATGSWVFAAQRRDLAWVTVAILATIVVCLAFAHRHIVRADLTSRADQLFIRAPLALYFGWCSAAVFANIAASLRDAGVTQPGGEFGSTIVLLAAVTAFTAATTIALRGSAWYAAAVVWALAAVSVANLNGETRDPNTVVAAAAGVAGLIVIGAVFVGRRRAARA